jgi:Mrp family chromosome partitioning ATPase
VVLCLRAGYVQRPDAKSCRDRLRQADVRLLGAVLNCHRNTEGSYRGRRGGYGSYGDDAYGASESEIGKVAAL